MNNREKLNTLYNKLTPLHKVVFKLLYKKSIDEIEDDKLDDVIKHCERLIEAANKPKTTAYPIPPTITQLPNLTINTTQPKEPQFCLCGNKPNVGDIFFYQSKYSIEPQSGEVAQVGYDTIKSKNGTTYRFSEIIVKPKYLIREEILNKILNNEN